ncbi:tripartite tricarboxylate transporter permease [Chelativorans sp. AA-79]|uniref:tripartite tricarboxylate transporter permease n=1 Tax=Chelativorans sp. AA-79 TaxID=3028735 RepID=UPI0023FA4329|nr:tripartite tricarboxylate transporter permease [Chelativorans sp. AA-79]WEX10657.1 tripartite tricarboxylate transporter permease [Chelativorans sp. AA-79]
MDVSVLDSAASALMQLLTGPHLLYLFGGVLLGLLIGILPGLGGIAGMALLLPFVYGMDQGPALAMMIGLTSVTATSDTFPSVLLGIPGSSSAQATVLDGFAMAKKGEAARALSAAFGASMIGGVFGALVLTFAFVAARPILLAIGFGEQLMLVILALTLVGMLTGPSVVKGLASCGLGLLIGSIGASQATAEYRFTFDWLYLTDGIPLVIVGLGIFAIPEMIDILRHQSTIAERGLIGKGWLRGLRDVKENFGLVLRCSGIGAVIGFLPGLGGSVIDWVAYGHVVQTSKDKSRFGHGDVRGVIAPESANNAKEGGALIPTLFFGIPGSGTMALLLGGLVLIGLTPGRSMVTDHVDLVYVIIWSIAIANILGAGLSILISRPVALLTAVRYPLIAPLMVVTIFFAAFQASRDWGDFVMLLLAGILGVYMKRFGWSRAALLIGFVLSARLESSLYRTVQIYGFEIFLRPISILILLVAVASAYFALRAKAAVSDGGGTTPASYANRIPQLVFAGVILAFSAAIVINVWNLRFLAYVFPVSVAAITAALVVYAAVGIARGSTKGALVCDTEAELPPQNASSTTMVHHLAWLAGLPLLSALIGFLLAAPLYVFVFLTVVARASLLYTVIATAAIVLLLVGLSELLVLVYPEGLLQQFVDFPGNVL